MKRQTTITKIILCLIIFVLVVSISPFAIPAEAATTSMSNLYSNPNQSGNNTYKFKVSDVVNSNLLTNVVGCTGVVNKVATWMANFVQSPAQTAKKAYDKIVRIKEQLKSSCQAVKAGAEMVGGVIPFVNDAVTGIDTTLSQTPLPKINMPSNLSFGSKMQIQQNANSQITLKTQTPEFKPSSGTSGGTASNNEKLCAAQVEATDTAVLKKMADDSERAEQAKQVEQCFNGIAITLMKNQLTAMTRSMMNWVNSGYGGNPFFVRNMVNLTNSIERNVIETGVDILLSPGIENPYARDFARSTIRSRGIVSSSAKFLGGLQSDLGAFISDPVSYYTDAQLNAADQTQFALMRARQANNSFQNDFATGGWNAWLALTQRDNNNPLGFSMLADEYLTQTQIQQVSVKKDEVTTNGGFLNQQVCIQWQVYNEDGTPKNAVNTDPGNMDGSSPFKFLPLYQKTDPTLKGEYGKCTQYETITPGSIIKEKTTAYLNSPERQIELAKTINDSLNALFSVLLSKLQGSGLSGLSDASTDASMNWTDSLNSNYYAYTSPDGNSTYDNNGSYDGFNITRDLGNTYLHTNYQDLGTWNATECLPGTNGVTDYTTCNITTSKDQKLSLAQALNPSSGPAIVTDANNVPVIPNINTYYTVNNPGKTKLVIAGNNNWENGDRAFWDGKEWQNWKWSKGQKNPIKRRGVLQTQEDFIVASQAILKVLPGIMPKLGELDYCLPGPNPSYKTNSTEAESTYQNWLGSMYVGLTDSSNKRFGVQIDNAGSRTYDDLHNTFVDNPSVWGVVLDSMKFLLYAFSNICNDARSQDCMGNYFYADPVSREDTQHLGYKTTLKESNLDYGTNNMFQNFYDIFDPIMNKLYFGNITQEYFLNEWTGEKTKNDDYVEMAQSGYDITKDMMYYYNETNQSIQDYSTAVSQVMVNISKLKPIRDEVSKIISEAQSARNKVLAALPVNIAAGITTPAQIQTKYASCLAEEDIQVFDAEDIGPGSESGNCGNQIDDDYDGLVDLNDPDCPGYVNPNTDLGNTISPITTYYSRVTTCPATIPSQSFEVSHIINSSITTVPNYNVPYSWNYRLRDNSNGNLYNVISQDYTTPSNLPKISATLEFNTNTLTGEQTIATGCPAGAIMYCPAGWTGDPPNNCVAPAGTSVCPVGWTGDPPNNCVAPVVVDPGTGTGNPPASSTVKVSIYINAPGGGSITVYDPITNANNTSSINLSTNPPQPAGVVDVTQTQGQGGTAYFYANPEPGKTVNLNNTVSSCISSVDKVTTLPVTLAPYGTNYYRIGPLTSACSVWVAFN